MSRDTTLNLPIGLVLQFVNPFVFIVSCFIFLLARSWLKREHSPEDRVRKMTKKELACCKRIAEIEAMPEFGMIGLGLPPSVFREYKNLLLQRDAIVL